MSGDWTLAMGDWQWNSGGLVSSAVLVLLLGSLLFTQYRVWHRLRRGKPPPGTTESPTANRWRWLAVAGLNVLAYLCVALLLAPPQHSRVADRALTLLTEGSGDAALAAADSALVYAIGNGNARALPQVQTLLTPGQLALRHPDLGRLRVLGDGLSDAQWASMPDTLQVDYQPVPLNGPVAMSWPRQLELGESLALRGQLSWADPNLVLRIRLLDPAGLEVDSTAARHGQSFALRAVPRAAGRFTYRLQVSRGETTLLDEPVPLSIRAPSGARLLVLQSAPSYEIRQLANWAGDAGNPMVIDTQISADRSLQQGINLPEGAPLSINPTLLRDSDLAIMDGRRWVTMSQAQQSNWLAAVEAGLGLILLADQALAEYLASPVGATPIALQMTRAEDAPEADWPGWDGVVLDQPLPVLPYRLRGASARWLTLGENGRVLEAYVPLGRGRLAVSLLRERHGWLTGEARDSWTRYWARLMQVLGRPTEQRRWLPPAENALSRVGEQQTLCARGTQEALSLRSAGDDIVDTGTDNLKRPTEMRMGTNRTGAPVQCATVWLHTPGWHRYELLDSASEQVLDALNLFVHDAQEWRTVTQANRQTASLRRAARSSGGGPVSGTQTVLSPMSPYGVWWVLLLSCALLWLERKLSQN